MAQSFRYGINGLCGDKIAADGDLRAGLLGRMVQFFIVGLIDEIVLIHKSDPISTGTVNARIFGTVHALVFLMDHPDPAVSFCNGITHGGTVIRGAIVHQNHFKIPESLVQNSVNAPIQIFFAAARRIRATPMVHVTSKLQRQELVKANRFLDGKDYEDAFMSSAILEQINKVACLAEPLYRFRINPQSVTHRKIVLKNLDEIDANYGLLACALKYGKKDTAFLQYVLMKRMLRNTKKNLPPKQRNSERVQQAEACLKKAGREVRQQGACTLRNAAETALCIANPQFYFNFKYRK